MPVIWINPFSLSVLTAGCEESIANGRAHEAIEISLVGAVRWIEDFLHGLWVVDIKETIGAHPGDEGRLILVRKPIHILQKGCRRKLFSVGLDFQRTYSADSSFAGPCQWRASPRGQAAARRPGSSVCGSTENITTTKSASWPEWCRPACRWTGKSSQIESYRIESNKYVKRATLKIILSEKPASPAQPIQLCICCRRLRIWAT